MGQHPSSHCRALTGRKMHADAMMPHPVPSSPFLESSCLRGRHLGTSARGRTASSPRRMAGCQLLGMPLGSGHRLGGGARLGRGRVICWPFGASRMPWRPLLLASPFDALGERLLGASSFAVAQGFPPPLQQALPIPPLPSGQERPSARLLEDLTQETHSFLKERAGFPSPVPLPQQAGRSLHQDARPSLRRIWSPMLVDACLQLITCNPLKEKLMGQSTQPQRFLRHCVALASKRSNGYSRQRDVSPR
jgi:hypothetical protein